MELPIAISRRRFAGLLGAGIASAALRPVSRADAALLLVESAEPAGLDGMVRLSSNENPYGPPPAAFDAMRQAFDRVWRYPDEAADDLAADLARLHGVGTDQVLLGNGSSEILKLCAAAFTGPGRPVAMAEPTFEAVARYARAAGGEAIRVRLTADHRHDVAGMLEAARAAGLLYPVVAKVSIAQPAKALLQRPLLGESASGRRNPLAVWSIRRVRKNMKPNWDGRSRQSPHFFYATDGFTSAIRTTPREA